MQRRLPAWLLAPDLPVQAGCHSHEPCEGSVCGCFPTASRQLCWKAVLCLDSCRSLSLLLWERANIHSSAAEQARTECSSHWQRPARVGTPGVLQACCHSRTRPDTAHSQSQRQTGECVFTPQLNTRKPARFAGARCALDSFGWLGTHSSACALSFFQASFSEPLALL